MSRRQKAASWTLVIVVMGGLASDVFNYFTNRDDAHETVAATIATTDELRWRAHDREHDLHHLDNIRVLVDLRGALAAIEELKIAIASVRKQALLYDQGYDKAAKLEASKADALLMPKEPALPHPRIKSRRANIADMEIELEPKAVQKKAEELYAD
ncbi:hypothetical protein LCGC14_0424700 [marine sediment metagenome]|uniref:Uncharacterized protein n=1 Tax=marine sediment metagenome TaxID=412755 RepID=A0A0F9VZ57_9ZZZZ